MVATTQAEVNAVTRSIIAMEQTIVTYESDTERSADTAWLSQNVLAFVRSEEL